MIAFTVLGILSGCGQGVSLNQMVSQMLSQMLCQMLKPTWQGTKRAEHTTRGATQDLVVVVCGGVGGGEWNQKQKPTPRCHQANNI